MISSGKGRHIKPVESPGRLSLYSMRRLEYLLGIPRERLTTLAETAGRFYEPFESSPRLRPFQRKIKQKKPRIIDNPLDELKRIQSRINARLLRPLYIPRYLCGGIAGRSILDNVKMHLGARCLVTIDIRSFFPNVTNLHIYSVWQTVLGCSPEIASLLTRLTTFERHLPQGAPTSTMLANLVLHMVDGPIRAECANQDVNYSTWVDDLAFSGESARYVIQTAVTALRRGGFAVSHRKLRIMGPKDRKELNGLVVSNSVGIHPSMESQIRAGIHNLRCHKVPQECLPGYLRSLRGRIAYVSRIVPGKGARFHDALQSARDYVAMAVDKIPKRPSSD